MDKEMMKMYKLFEKKDNIRATYSSRLFNFSEYIAMDTSAKTA